MKTVTEVVKVEELRAYLEAHGLRVVRGGWRAGEARPWIITGPELPAKTISEEERVEADGDQD